MKKLNRWLITVVAVLALVAMAVSFAMAADAPKTAAKCVCGHGDTCQCPAGCKCDHCAAAAAAGKCPNCDGVMKDGKCDKCGDACACSACGAKDSTCGAGCGCGGCK
jgi:hypothetical protein